MGLRLWARGSSELQNASSLKQKDKDEGLWIVSRALMYGEMICILSFRTLVKYFSCLRLAVVTESLLVRAEAISSLSLLITFGCWTRR
jgi:hypothetical protein